MGRMESSTQATTRKVFGGRISLFKQPASNNWFARFYINRVRYATTLKTPDDKEAEQRAENWYIETVAAVKQGIAPATKKSNSFASCADEAISLYEEKASRNIKSPRYVRELRIIYNRLKPMIGTQDIHNIDQSCWVKVRKTLLADKPTLSEKTLHQYKNAIQVCLSTCVERGIMKEDDKPRFVRESSGNQQDTPRTYFGGKEYKALITALRSNIAKHKRDKTRWIEDAEELRDFVLIDANTGMRVGELSNVRFCDVTIATERDSNKEYLEIRNIVGKRGRGGVCKSYYGAANAFKRCIARHGLTVENYITSETLIFKAYHRDMFREVLKAANLYKTNDRPPLKRDMK